MRKSAAEYIRELEQRIARLERQAGADEVLAYELELFIVNDGGLYRKAQLIIKNQARHLKAGTWNMKGALKGFLHLVDAGIKQYRRELGGLPPRIDSETKLAVSKALLSRYKEEIEIEAEMSLPLR